MEMEVSENTSLNLGGNAAQGPSAKPAKPGGKKKTIEQTYQKLTQLEHVLLRPDTYIGSTQRQQQTLWVHDGERLVHRGIQVSPGLYKIFDEILVNAADNKIRDSNMKALNVEVDQVEGSIKVFNDGAGVPVEIHKEHGVYVPELIFGHLLTSSNYDDKEKKVTGGRNGYGAKLANIFSKEFVVETCDGIRKRRYKQVFRNNMSDKGEPVITPCSASENWTCITFKPDLTRFEMAELEEDTISLFRKRVYDMAGVLGKTVKVSYNGEVLPVKDFQAYVDMYLGPKETGPPRVYERVNERWEVVISVSDGQFQQVSFVNSICTSKGGTHVNAVEGQVTKHLLELMAKKHKQAAVKAHMVKSYLWVFVNCLIENPAFDSQAKETMTLLASGFGSSCPLSEGLLKKFSACGVVDSVLRLASFRADKELKKGDGAKRSRLTGIPKLDDANDAGGRNSAECTLILTEGDSAKTLAIAGLGVVGRDKYGVFPLRGKLLNVRDASTAQITGNAEIQNIKQILGLQHGKQYGDTKSLRYGHLMIMTDQDHDGSHIKGLIMNYFHHFYPSLLQVPGFLVEFITPIIKATKGNQSRAFYTLPEYEAWCEESPRRGWKIKYYKGLGTSTADEARQYFAALGHHRKEFVWEGAEDGLAIEMAFSKKKVEERKDWLRAFVPGTFLDHNVEHISYSEFVHRELILFSRADLERSIPSAVDGLKPGQRKILFACFKRNLRTDIKVAQLAGYVAEHSAYHHGEASLQGTIVGLAQNFVGSNNINLLVPQGQFGTRLQGGKDAASARYIFTRLATLARAVFHEADDPLLEYQNEEGQDIEPVWYAPVVPMVLINGAEGIGTGWSTSIPNHDPEDIVDNLRRLLAGEDTVPMKPWYRGFSGTIEEVSSRGSGRSYQITGTIRQVDDTTLEISELPVRRWTQDYKEFLEDMVKPEDRNAQPFITDYREHHTDVNVKFVVTLPEARMREALTVGLENKFKLSTKISCSNMMLFNPEGVIQKYDTPEDVLREFYELRLGMYAKRRASLLRTAEAELLRLSNKTRFIIAVVDGELLISNRKRADIEADLESRGFDRLPTNKRKAAAAAAAAAAAGEGEGDEEGSAGAEGSTADSYDYLLSMPLASLTLEKVEALQQETEGHREAVARLHATTPQELWSADLDAFIELWRETMVEDDRRAAMMIKQQAQARKDRAKATKGKAKGKKKASAWSDDEDDELDEESEEELDSDGEPIPRRPAAARKPAARSARPAPSSSMLTGTSSRAASGSTTTASRATTTSRPAVTGAAAGAPAAAGHPVPKPQPSVPLPQPDQEMSLMAARMGGLTVLSNSTGVPGASVGGSKNTAAGGRKPRGAGTTSASVVAIDSPSEQELGWDVSSEGEVNSPSLGFKAGGGLRRGAKAAGGAGPSKLGAKRKPAGGSGKSGTAPVPVAGAAVPVPARAPTPTDLDADSVDVSSPMVVKPKVQRMRPSPFHKGSGESKPGAKPSVLGKSVSGAGAGPKRAGVPAGTKKGKTAVIDDDETSASEGELSGSDDDVISAAVPTRAPGPRRAAAARPRYNLKDDGSDGAADSDVEEVSDVESEDYVPSDDE